MKRLNNLKKNKKLMEFIVLYVNYKWFSFFGFWSRRVGMSYTNAKENEEL